MRTLLVVLTAAGVSSGLAARPAAADGPAAPSCGRVATIPAWTERVARQETVEPCYQQRWRDICEVTEEPVYETRCVPQTVSEFVPIYVLKAVPIYEVRRVPVYGEVDVPVYATRQVPVKVPWFHPCSPCKERMATLFHRSEEIQIGTGRERRCLGWKEEHVQVGTRNERVQCGHELRERVCGWKSERVCVGTRPVKRVVDSLSDWKEISPATTRTVEDLVPHAARTVTVVPDASPASARVLLPGTESVMTETEYRAALRTATAR